MKKLTLIIIALLTGAFSFSQTIVVGGRCITGNVTLTYVTDVDGKPAYLGTGTVAGNAGTEVSIFWIPAPDNFWVIAFDGQPYFQNACNTDVPPGSAKAGCTWDVVSGTDCTGGAALSVTGAVSLPVSLTQFTATVAGTAVDLQWTTAQEANNHGFTVQRSADGLQWTDLGFVAGAGNASTPSHYRYTDKQPGTGVHLYRLQQQDLDGKTSFSATVTATITGAAFFSISDNPGNGLYKLSMPASGEPVEILVTDATGRVVLRNKTLAGNQSIDLTRQSPGTYWLRIKTGINQTGIKLIKF